MGKHLFELSVKKGMVSMAGPRHRKVIPKKGCLPFKNVFMILLCIVFWHKSLSALSEQLYGSRGGL